MNWKAVCLAFISCQLSGLLGVPLHIILSPDEASKLLTREAHDDFKDGINKFLNTQVDVSKTVYDENYQYDLGPPAMPQDSKMKNNKRSELLGRIKELLNDISDENVKKSVILKGKIRQDSKARVPSAGTFVDENSMEVLEKTVNNLIKEIQTERKRVIVRKRAKIINANAGRSTQKLINPGKRGYELVEAQKLINPGKRGHELEQAQKLINPGKRGYESEEAQKLINPGKRGHELDEAQKLINPGKRDYALKEAQKLINPGKRDYELLEKLQKLINPGKRDYELLEKLQKLINPGKRGYESEEAQKLINPGKRGHEVEETQKLINPGKRGYELEEAQKLINPGKRGHALEETQKIINPGKRGYELEEAQKLINPGKRGHELEEAQKLINTGKRDYELLEELQKLINPGKRSHESEEAQKLINPGKRSHELEEAHNLVSDGRESQKMVVHGRDFEHRNVGKETLNKIQALVQKLKKASESARKEIVVNIETDLAKKEMNNENLVKSTAARKEEKKSGKTFSQSIEASKDRRALMKELLDTYNEMMGKGNKRMDSYRKGSKDELQSIVSKPNSDNSKVSKETAKVISGFSVISDQKESAKSVELSAEDIINKAREMS